jgi:murein DD-endopeptidase MepM/ murein hydrolase activator NlpD
MVVMVNYQMDTLQNISVACEDDARLSRLRQKSNKDRLRGGMSCTRSALLALVVLPAAAGQTQHSAAPHRSATAWSIRWQPMRLVNGAPLVLQVTPPVRLQSLAATWLGHEVPFSFDARSKTWYAIAGISLDTKPATYTLQLKGTAAQGRQVAQVRQITVKRERYPTIAVSVARQFTAPSPQQMEEINRDKSLKQEIFSHLDPTREWGGKFEPPVAARVSDVFGTRRVFNGETQSTHQGLDYAVPQGTPVSALNAGTVLLARPLYFEGSCIVLDHGQGLLSLYLHLSEFKVKEGEHVSRGQEIGVSGGTGRATGPHLHIAVRWQGIYVNPATLLRLDLP